MAMAGFAELDLGAWNERYVDLLAFAVLTMGSLLGDSIGHTVDRADSGSIPSAGVHRFAGVGEDQHVLELNAVTSPPAPALRE